MSPGASPISRWQVWPDFVCPVRCNRAYVLQPLQEHTKRSTYGPQVCVELLLFPRLVSILVNRVTKCMPAAKDGKQLGSIALPVVVQLHRESRKHRQGILGYLALQPNRDRPAVSVRQLLLKLMHDPIDLGSQHEDLVVENDGHSHSSIMFSAETLLAIFSTHPLRFFDRSPAAVHCNDHRPNGAASGECANDDGSPVGPVTHVRSQRTDLDSHTPSMLVPILP